MSKKDVRRKFRDDVFGRDKGRCLFCGAPAVDAHHITDRNEMPKGGYVKENGISLCARDHILVEMYHSSGKSWWVTGKHPDDLYRMIGSSREAAIEALGGPVVTMEWFLTEDDVKLVSGSPAPLRVMVPVEIEE